jgi:hypothetical protein
MSEVLLELTHPDNNTLTSYVCVTNEKFRSLMDSFENKSIHAKLGNTPHKELILRDDFVDFINVISDQNKISAFKTLHGTSHSTGINLLNLLFIINNMKTPAQFVYDDDDEEDDDGDEDDIEGSIDEYQKVINLLSEMTSMCPDDSDETLETDEEISDEDLDFDLSNTKEESSYTKEDLSCEECLGCKEQELSSKKEVSSCEECLGCREQELSTKKEVSSCDE